MSKISIIGAGHVGATVAYTAVVRELVDEVVLVNRTPQRAEGEAADLRHAAAFVGRTIRVRSGDVAATEGSELVVITISIPSGPELQDRMDLAEGNAALLAEWVPEIAAASPESVLLVVTNPVDVMTYWTWQLSGFPPSRVIGTGTLIDSARFRSYLSEHLQIHPDDIRAYILGEHGESQFPAMSVAATGGAVLDAEPVIRQCFERAREAGMEVFRLKGFTNYAIAMATALIIESVVRDSRRTLPVSTFVEHYHGVRDVCLSVPAIIGRRGVLRHLSPSLSPQEIEAFRASAARIRAAIDALPSVAAHRG